MKDVEAPDFCSDCCHVNVCRFLNDIKTYEDKGYFEITETSNTPIEMRIRCDERLVIGESI